MVKLTLDKEQLTKALEEINIAEENGFDGIITVELNMKNFRVYDDVTMELFKNEFNKLIK